MAPALGGSTGSAKGSQQNIVFGSIDDLFFISFGRSFAIRALAPVNVASSIHEQQPLRRAKSRQEIPGSGVNKHFLEKYSPSPVYFAALPAPIPWSASRHRRWTACLTTQSLACPCSVDHGIPDSWLFCGTALAMGEKASHCRAVHPPSLQKTFSPLAPQGGAYKIRSRRMGMGA